MKIASSHLRFSRPLSSIFPLLAAALAILAFSVVSHAASNSWNVDAAGNWATAGSWLGGVDIPGSTTTDNSDVASFNLALAAGRLVTVDANRYIGEIDFGNTSNFGYTLQTGILHLNNGGLIQTLSGNGNHTDTISSAIVLDGVGGSATFTAGATSSTSLLAITTGGITGVSTASNTTTLNLNGTNTGANLVSAIIGNGAAGGNLAVVKSGAGTWTLSGANTFSGGLTIQSGTLQTSTSASAIGTGAITLGSATGGDATLLWGYSSGSPSNAINVVAGTGTRTLEMNQTGSVTFSGAISLNNDLIVDTFTGTTSNGLTLSGAITGSNKITIKNTAAGTAQTTISGSQTTFTGAMEVASGATLSAGNGFVSNGTVNVLSGGTFSFQQGASIAGLTGVSSGGIASTGQAKALTLTGNGSYSFAGAIQNGAGVASLVMNGSGGTQTLSGTNSYTGTTTVTAGTLKVTGTLTGNGTITVNGGTLLAANTAAFGSSALTLTTGTLDLATDTSGNAYNATIGNTTTFTIASDKATAGSAGITQTLGTLSIGNSTLNVIAGSNVSGGSPMVAFGNVTLSNTGNVNITFNPTTAGLSLANVNMLSSNTTNQTVVLDGTAAANEIAGVISNVGGGAGTGKVAVTKSNSSIWTLSGVNTYTGGTTVSAGTLLLSGSGTLGATSGALTVNTGGTLDLNGTSQNVGGFSGTGGTILNNGGGNATLTIGNGNGTGTYSGLITDKSTGSGTVAVAKTGTGSITMSNNSNTFSGGTVVNGGQLNALTQAAAGTTVTGGVITSGPFGTGTITLNDGSTLGTRSTTALTLANPIATSGIVTMNGSGAAYVITFDQTGVTSPGGFVLNGDTTFVGAASANNINTTITGSHNLTLASFATSSGSTVVNGAINTTGDVIFLAGFGARGATAQAMTLAGSINNTGNIINNAYSGNFWSLSGTIGSAVTGVIQNGAYSGMSLTNDNSASNFGITVNAGILKGSNTAATNVLKALGTGTITLNGGQLILLAQGAGSNQTIVTGNGTTGNNVVVAGSFANPATIAVDRVAVANTGNTISFNNLTIGAQELTVLGADNYALRFAGTTTLTGNALFNLLPNNFTPGGVSSSTLTNPKLTLAGAVGGSGYGLSTLGTSALILTGTNTYTGVSTVYGGALQANDNIGLPGASSTGGGSNLLLNGGVLQSNAANTFTRNLGTGQNQVQFGAAGGGFAGNTGTLVVNLNGGTGTIAWGAANFLANGAPLLLGSTTANSAVDFQNGLNLAGGAQSVIVTDAGTSTEKISGVISDATGGGSLTKAGAGILTISGANTYAGTTYVTAGSLKIDGNTGSLSSSSSLTLGSTNTGAGTFIFDNTTSSAARTQSFATLTFGSGDGIVQSIRTASQNTALSFSSLSARASGATGNFLVTGGANGTSNKITLTGATLNAIIDPGLFFAGGSTSATYAYNDASGYVRGITYGTDTNAPAAVTGSQANLGVNDATKNMEFQGGSAPASTTNGSTASGSTTMVVADATKYAVGQAITASVGGMPVNTYVTAINTGTNTLTLSAATTAIIATGSTITPYNYVTAQTTASLNTLNLNGTGSGLTLGASQILTVNGILRSGNNGTMNIITGGSGSGIQAASNSDLVIRDDMTNDALMISTQILANGTNNLVKSGAGALTLNPTANNTFTGTTYVDSGTLNLTSTTAGVVVIPGNIVINGGTLSTSNGTTSRAGQIASSATVTLNAGGYTQSGTQQTLAGYTQNGGTTTFSTGSNTNDQLYIHNASSTAQTTLNGGTWKGNGGNYASSWTTDGITISGGNNTLYGAGANGSTTNGTIPLNIGAAGLTINQPVGGPFTALTMTQTQNNTSAPYFVLGGALTYNANANNSNPAIIAANTLIGYSTLANIALTGTTTFNIGHNANATQDLVIQPRLTDWAGSATATINTAAGVGGVTKTGTGVLAVSGNNTYTGPTTINDGTLSVDTLTNGEVMGVNLTTTNGVSTATVASTAGLSVGMSILGNSQVNNGYVILGISGNTIYMSGISGSTPGTNSTNFGLPSGLGISSNAASNLVINGGTLQYTGAATSTDRLFSIGTSGATLDASGTGALNFTNTSALGFNSQTGTRTLTLTGTNIGANTLTPIVGDNSGATSLTKTGTGTWTLSAANTFTGATTISAGTLVLSGGNINSTSGVSVSDGATFTNNSGTAFNKALTLTDGATLSGTGSFAPASMTLIADLSSFAPFAVGNLAKGGDLALTLSGITNGTYTLLSGSLSGAFSTMAIGVTPLANDGNGNFSGLVGSNYYTFTNANAQLIVAVPEPATWALLAFSLTTVVVLRRRRS